MLMPCHLQYPFPVMEHPSESCKWDSATLFHVSYSNLSLLGRQRQTDSKRNKMVSDGCQIAMHDKPHSNKILTHTDNDSHTCRDCKPTHSKHTHTPYKGAIVDYWRPLSHCLLNVTKHTAPRVCVHLHVCMHVCHVSVTVNPFPHTERVMSV